MKAYEYWMASTEGMGYKGYQLLKKHQITGKELYDMQQTQRDKLVKQGILRAKVAKELQNRSKIVPENLYHELAEQQIQVVLPEDAAYPKRLKKIPDSPLTLYYHGHLPEEAKHCVAVIGSRMCTEYGSYVARELGKTLAGHGIQLVSGMARGIDGICQRSAVEAGGSVYAVLGSGVNVCYPRENHTLYEKLWQGSNCGIFSEYPPGTQAKGCLFPPRNRIISGLADAVVVIEAREKSGTFITVDMALEQGKEVYALPGKVTDRLSDGCNRLLKEGANVFLSPEEFVRELKEEELAGAENLVDSWEKPSVELDEEESRVLKCLDFEPKCVEEIYEQTQIQLEKLLYLLTVLQMKGFVGRIGNKYVRKR